jgi:hypothetical protein
MSRFLNRCGRWVPGLSLLALAQVALAFSPYGPEETWQIIPLGYEKHQIVEWPDGTSWDIHGDDFAWHPHNLGEETRWNTPILYYTCDDSFSQYFGSNGVAAVDAAMAVFNTLSNVSSYSSDLHEFPLEESRVNYTASALHLFDLKSVVMEVVMERLGLVDPERWTWCLRSRILPVGAACPLFYFGVVQRNFDPVTWDPSSYVNGTLFTYEIEQSCPPGEDFGDAVEFLVDPDGVRYSALATPKLSLPDATFYGYFHTGLTRDDMGGLRYLYATNTMNIEGAGSNTVAFVTDTNTIQLLFTSNLNTFASQALTNTPAALLALYPGLSIASTTSIFTNIWVTNLTAYFTNYPYDPYGTPPHLAFVTNRTLTVQTWYHNTFNNVVTFAFTNGAWAAIPLPDIVTHTGRQWITVQTTTVTNSPYDPYGTPPHTNITSVTYATNEVAGEYFIVTNQCGISVLALQATTVIIETNQLTSATNSPVGFTNNQFFSQTVLNYFTNHVFLINPIDCVSNIVDRFQGIEKVTFIRRDLDPSGNFQPITNNYTLIALTTNGLVSVHIQRFVTQPDIVFSAADLEAEYPAVPTLDRSTPIFDLTGEDPNLAGPSVMRGPVQFTLNKVGPMNLNGEYPFFVDEEGALLDFVWGSYDATTNTPVVYPNGASIMNLENQVLIQIAPAYLPDGLVGIAYHAQLSTSAATPNWQSPFSWSLAPGSPGLPPGLSLSSGGSISGNPAQAGFYNFVVQAMDAVGRTVQRSYIINVAPAP